MNRVINFLVQRFQNLDSKDLGLWDLSMKHDRRQGTHLLSAASDHCAFLAWPRTCVRARWRPRVCFDVGWRALESHQTSEQPLCNKRTLSERVPSTLRLYCQQTSGLCDSGSCDYHKGTTTEAPLCLSLSLNTRHEFVPVL